MSKILENLYLGSYGDARNQAFLKKSGITHIVTVGVELQTLFPQSFKYLYIPAYDHPSYQLAPYFDQIADFIHNAIEKEKGTVFVHCQMGISRSTTSVISYLIKYHNMPPLKAGMFVKARRAIVYPNPGFLNQLGTYAKRLGVTDEKPGFKSLASSTSANGFSVTNGAITSPKKEVIDLKKSDVKTLAMTSSSWRAANTQTKESDRRSMSITTSNWKANVKEESKTLDNDKAVAKEYSCKTCGTKLFDASNIQHDAKTTGLCTMIYVKHMPWIGYSKGTSAKVYCPNGKCNTILGFSNQNGGKCPCGKRVEPMYGLYPLKLSDTAPMNVTGTALKSRMGSRMGETLKAW